MAAWRIATETDANQNIAACRAALEGTDPEIARWLIYSATSVLHFADAMRKLVETPLESADQCWPWKQEMQAARDAILITSGKRTVQLHCASWITLLEPDNFDRQI